MQDDFLRLLNDEDTVLVFPSEVVARFWRRRAVQDPLRRALSADRIVSWDAFKESVFQIRSEARPINAAMRRVFAAALLRENQKVAFLRAVVSPQYNENSAAFVTLLQRSLPSLQALVDRGALRRAHEPQLHDLGVVYDRYSAFLDKAGLFEPGWYRAGICMPDNPHAIVFPELIHDYIEVSADLERSAAVSVIPLRRFEAEAVGAAAPRVSEYANAHQEVHAVLSQVEALLDQGVEAEEIAISVAELEAYQPFLQRYAELHSIPLHFRRGQPLSDSAAGRFFRGLSTVVSSGFAFNPVRSLLLDQAVPWQRPRLGRALLRAAIDAGCLKRRLGSAGSNGSSGASAPGASDEWLRAVAAAEDQRGELRKYYLALRDSLNGVAAARGAAELRQRLIGFLGRFLDSERWDPQNLNVYQRALDELKQLVAAEASLGTAVEDSLALWLGVLDQTPYVENVGQPGVAVFPYRVAAGIRPRCHFVLNASHDGTRVLENPFSFIREDLRERLALPEQDFSDAFLRGYTVSGEAVRFSYSLQSFAGPRFSAGSLAGRAEAGQAESADPYRTEIGLWAAGLERVPVLLYPAQAEGLAFLARTGLRKRTTDFSRQPVASGPQRDRLLERSMVDAGLDAGPLLSLSANRIDSYRSCPFGHLLAHPLRIEELDFSVAVQPAMVVGNYQHAVLEAFYRRIAQQDPLMKAEKIEHYEQILEEVLNDEAPLRAAARALPRPVIELVRRLTREGVQRLLRAELDQLGSHRIERTELSLSRVFDRSGVLLTGRIDRLSSIHDDRGYILVDYKRRGSASRSQVVGRNGDPATIATVQLPVYMLLLEQEDARVERACYYLVERGKIVTIFDRDSGKLSLSEDERRQLLDYVVQTIESIASRLRAGDYRFPDPLVGCDGCRFRGICRARFAVE